MTVRHALIFVLALAPAIRAEAPSSIAIKDARIVTVSGPELAKGTVVMRDGLIQEVGPNASIPAGAWVIDGAGLTVYPGFINGLSTWGIPSSAPEPAPNRASGGASNTVQQAPPASATPRAHGPEDRPQTYSYERAADLVSPTDSKLENARAAGFTSSATFPNRGIVEGLGALIDLQGERGRDMVVAQPIGQQIVFRVGGGGMGRSFPSSLMGNIAYVRQLYLDLDQYRQAKAVYQTHPAGNPRPQYDHDLEGLAESPRLLMPADERQQIDRILAFGRELKQPFVVYGLHEAYDCVPELKQANVPLLVSLKWPEKPKDADPHEPQNLRQLQMEVQAPSVPGMLAKEGVRFGFYSDGIDSAPELKKAVKRALEGGLSRTDAIRALTLNVADMYGVSDRLGSIDKGKIANLVITKGEAFDDKSTIEYVFIDGKQFRPSKELQKGPEREQGSGEKSSHPAQPQDDEGDN